jgi:uncharacterized protein YdeI (YjbR/CyaY-like superfamily)
MSKNKVIDDYISQQEPFAQEIILHMRDVIHRASPEITETIKWRHPCFESNGLVCAIAAFKQHVNFSFFKGKLLNDSEEIFSASENNELTALKFKTLVDVPTDDILVNYLQQAISLNSADNKQKKQVQRKDKNSLVIPEDLSSALANNLPANEVFKAFSYSKQKDYIDWLTSAKRATTRSTRLNTAIEWISEGKPRHWKYENC